MTIPLTAEQTQTIEEIVALYESQRDNFVRFAGQMQLLTIDHRLARYVHSIKSRVKDPDHLRDKLRRKWRDAISEGHEFEITPDNLFSKINDLAGLRILHLYTRQFEHINRRLLEILEYEMIEVIEGPSARTWDTEYRDYFQALGVSTQETKRMYTSVHYIVQPNKRSVVTGEIQVRTLAEEIWGEVDHTINYPHESDKLACREQIRVLARVTSGVTRLVDAIFTTHEEGQEAGQSVNEASAPARSRVEPITGTTAGLTPT